MKVSRLVDSRKVEMIRLAKKLIEQDTTNPPGNEWRAAEIVKKFFRKEGIRYRIFENKKGRTNVIGYVGTGKPRLIIACHLDTVPAGDGWKTDPFKAVVKKERIYGRGANDNKGPLASMLIAGKIIKGMQKKIKGQLILACVADEEEGSKNGMYYLVKKNKLQGEYAIVPDISREMKWINIAEKGILKLKVTSTGKQAHGSRPHQGINAVWNMIDFLNMVRKYRMRYRKHWLLSKPTLNLGVIKGGQASNIVPGKCQALLDIRYIPGQRPSRIVRDIKKIAMKTREKNAQARLKIEVIREQGPFEVSKDNILIKTIKKHTKTVRGKTPKIIGLSGTTVVKPLALKGIYSVGFSCGEDVAHKANEYISIDQMNDFAKIITLVCLDILG